MTNLTNLSFIQITLDSKLTRSAANQKCKLANNLKKKKKKKCKLANNLTDIQLTIDEFGDH
jgi:hypothetical protein